MKVCSKCRKSLPEGEFRRIQRKSGLMALRNRCRKCESADTQARKRRRLMGMAGGERVRSDEETYCLKAMLKARLALMEERGVTIFREGAFEFDYETTLKALRVIEE